jgi:CubicO group peptidase (beta-lactamase class C family)
MVLAPAIVIGVPASAQQAGHGTPPGAIARAREALGDAVRGGAAPGAAVAIAAGGRIVWSEGFGVSNLASGAPVDPGTRFGVGSISKTLTLTAAITLAEDGKLDLDAPIERYLPEFPHRGSGVTVRRIGAHQGGIVDSFATLHYYSTEHFPTLDSAYRLISAAPMGYRPGSRSEYATGLFTIVGRVLERVGGSSYLEVMRSRVLEPVGLAATMPNDPRRPPRDRTTFYLPRDDGGFDPAPPADPSFKLPGAGFLSTAEDLARFGAALLEPGLLSDAGRHELFTPVPLADGTPTRDALGFQSLEENGRRVLLQPGGGPGIAAWLAVYPDDDLVVAILSNATGAPLGDTVRRAVADAFLRPPAPGPPPRPARPRPPGT